MDVDSQRARGSAVRAAGRFAPAAVVLATWIALLPASGGFFARSWMPAALVLVTLAIVTVAGSGRLLPAPRAARLAVLALLAATAWAFASVTWAHSPGEAWSHAGHLLMHVAAVSLLTLLPWTWRAADVLVGGFCLGVAAVCTFELLDAAAASSVADRFGDGRWAEPLGYPNGAAAIAAMGALPALVMSARPRLPTVVKSGALGVAMLLAAIALLPQSRGAVLGALAAVGVALVVVPFRWRLAIRVAVVAAGLALAWDPIAALYAGEVVPAGELIDAAVRAALVAAAGATLAGLVLALIDTRLRPGPRALRVARYAGVAVVAAGVVAVGAVAAARAERISTLAADQWEAMTQPGGEFGEPEEPGEADGSRLLDADPLQRYDYWRVSLNGFRDSPVLGLGAGGFADRYEAERRYVKHSSKPHNLTLRVIAELGIVGTILAAVFVAAVGGGILRRLRAAGVPERGVAGGALALATYFAVHAQFDWLEAFPVMMGPALAFPLVALLVLDGPTRDAVRLRGRAALAAVCVCGLAGLVAIGAPWLSLRYREQAAERWRADPAAAYRALDRAAKLDPLSAAPHLVEGTIALQRDELDRARAAFEEAVEREDPWLAHFELALVTAAGGDREAARRHLDRAEALNPLEPAIAAAREALQSREPVDPVALNRRLFESPLFSPGRLP